MANKRILFDELDRVLKATINVTEKVLLSQYIKSLTEIDSKISKIYSKYAENGILSRPDMIKFGRLKSLQDNILVEVDSLTKLKSTEINKLVKEVYTESSLRTFNSVVKELPNTSLLYIHPSKALILASVNNPIDGLTINQRLADHAASVKKEISDQITQGLIQGESYFKMGERIRGSLEGDLNKAITVARTEAHRNQNAARQESYNQLSSQGIYNIRKEWLSVKAKNTRDSHIRLDGQRVPVDGYFEIDGNKAQYPGNFGIAKEDVNCRCTTVIVLL